MSLTPILVALFAFSALCVLLALTHGVRARRHWRERRRFAASHRLLWCLVFLLLAALGGLSGLTLLGYRRIAAEAPVERIDTRRIAPERYAVVVTTPDGASREVELAGDDWQLDARVIKWKLRAVALGAPPLYRLDRISGRRRDVASEAATPKSVVALSSTPTLDLWQLKHRFPDWLPWIDADYGSAAYLPLVDDGHFEVTLAAAGGLVARPADAVTTEKLKAAGW